MGIQSRKQTRNTQVDTEADCRHRCRPKLTCDHSGAGKLIEDKGAQGTRTLECSRT